MVTQQLGAELSKSDLNFIKSLNPSPHTSTQKEGCALFRGKKQKQNKEFLSIEIDCE